MCHLRECRSIRARRFQASLLPHTTCVRSCCTRRDSCVAAKHHTKKWLSTYKYTFSKQHSCGYGLLRECRSIWLGASGLPCYCAPLVCVPTVIGLLTVWLYNKPKPKSRREVDSPWKGFRLQNAQPSDICSVEISWSLFHFRN